MNAPLPKRQCRPTLYALAAVMLALLPTLGSSSFAAHSQAALETQQTTTQDASGQVQVTVLTPKVPIVAGQPFIVTITAVVPRDSKVAFPEIEKRLGPFNILEFEPQPDIPTGTGRRFRWDLIVDSMEPGQQDVPTLELQVHNTQSGETTAVTTQAVPLTITSSLGDAPEQAALRDIRGPIDISLSRPWPWWAWVVLGGTLTVGVLGFIFLLAKRRKEDERAAMQPLLPADLEALAAIDQLESEQLLASARFHVFYTRLSNIVRHYIERRFTVMAPERTTDEFLREIRHRAMLTGAQKDALGGFLRAADMVKFAKHEPLPQEGNAALLGARQFIEETRPQETSAQNQTKEVA